MTSGLSSKRIGGLYVVTPHTDQVARMLCVKIGQPVILTLGEYALFRRDNRTEDRWVKALDVAWQGAGRAGAGGAQEFRRRGLTRCVLI